MGPPDEGSVCIRSEVDLSGRDAFDDQHDAAAGWAPIFDLLRLCLAKMANCP